MNNGYYLLNNVLNNFFNDSYIFHNNYAKRKSIEKKIDALKNNAITMTPEEFLSLRNTRFGVNGKKVASQYNFEGVYILYNKSKNMHYVG